MIPYANEAKHKLRTPKEEIAFTARQKIYSHSQFFWYGRSIFWLPHRPNLSDIFDFCLYSFSIDREAKHPTLCTCIREKSPWYQIVTDSHEKLLLCFIFNNKCPLYVINKLHHPSFYVCMSSWLTLYFYNNEPSKNKHFLILPSSLARYWQKPRLKIIFEILLVLFEKISVLYSDWPKSWILRTLGHVRDIFCKCHFRNA